MLLSHKYKFLYVHIAKTGGTSMRAALNRLRWQDPIYYLMWPCHKLSSLTGHTIGTKLPRHAGVICAKEMLPNDFFNALFKFAFVRNPWDLQVSSFHHVQRERPHMLNGITDFNEFLKYKFDPEWPYLYHIDIASMPQTDYLLDLHGNIIVDFVGRFERLHDDSEHIKQRLGLAKLKLPHKRQATDRKKDYRTYYSDESIESVAKHFEQDIRLLNYSFDPQESADE